MDEQMIELIARAIDEAFDYDIPRDDAVAAARAAHSVIAGKVAELEGALKDARFCINALEAQLIGFARPVVNVEFVVCKIDAALAPYPERRSE